MKYIKCIQTHEFIIILKKEGVSRTLMLFMNVINKWVPYRLLYLHSGQ